MPKPCCFNHKGVFLHKPWICGKKGELVCRHLWTGCSSVSCPILRGQSTWLGLQWPSTEQPTRTGPGLIALAEGCSLQSGRWKVLGAGLQRWGCLADICRDKCNSWHPALGHPLRRMGRRQPLPLASSTFILCQLRQRCTTWNSFQIWKMKLPQIHLHSLAAFDYSTTQDCFLTSDARLVGPPYSKSTLKAQQLALDCSRSWQASGVCLLQAECSCLWPRGF